jgi:hypothetical protein
MLANNKLKLETIQNYAMEENEETQSGDDNNVQLNRPSNPPCTEESVYSHNSTPQQRRVCYASKCRLL